MELREFSGDLFKSDCDVICHQVNCKGVMGMGLNKAIRKRYPIVFEQYNNFVTNNTFYVKGIPENSSEFLGLCQIVKIGDGKYIANLFGQEDYGREQKQYTNYDALLCSLFALRRLVLFGGYNIKSIAFPCNLGCGFAGGDWNKVREMIISVFAALDVRVDIISLPGSGNEVAGN
jgi:O-acetyl-ADP-ribose deacetylase (regulator of RNase III)